MVLIIWIAFLFAQIIEIKPQDGLSQIGSAIEAFRTCNNRSLTMERIIGGPPSKENYWDGSLNIDKLYPNLNEVRVTLQLDASAIVSVDPEEGRILTSDIGYHISFFKPDNGFKLVKFKVQGKQNGDFPNVAYLKLNGADICPNPDKWKPSILGAHTNTGTIDFNNEQKVSTEQQTCGQRKIQHEGLITHGFPSHEGDWPWHAALFHIQINKNIRYACGGSLLNSNTILTAAHCIIDGGNFMIPERVLIKLGLHNRLLASRNTQEFQVHKLIPHENFGFNDYKNDIALLRLSTEATFTQYVQPICLWPPNKIDLQNVVNEIGIVIGWGFTEKSNEPSEILSQGRMPIVDTFTCLNSNRKFFGIILSDQNFCAGYKNGTSVCNGDSGGGLILKKGDSYQIRGIVSLGVSKENEDICNPEEFVIFTDVAKYLDWIKEKY